MSENLKTKQQLREDFEEWLEGFTNTTRFLNPINWEISFCAQYKKENRKTHKNQMVLL